MFGMHPFVESHGSFQKRFQLQDKMGSTAAPQRQCHTLHHLIQNCQDKGCAHLISPFAAPAALTFPSAEGLWAGASTRLDVQASRWNQDSWRDGLKHSETWFLNIPDTFTRHLQLRFCPSQLWLGCFSFLIDFFWFSELPSACTNCTKLY